MSRNQQIQKRYLRGFATAYTDTVVRPQGEIYRIVSPLLENAAFGDVLLLGAGPLTTLSGPRVASVTALDLSESMLRQSPEGPNSRAVCADASVLPFVSESFDTVVLPFILHHLGGDSPAGTRRIVSSVLREAARVLRPGGILLIVDLFLPPSLERILRLLYVPTVLALNAFSRPMMYFHSLPGLRRLLAPLPLSVDEKQLLVLSEPLVLTLLAPSFKISPGSHPARFHFIRCSKTS